MPFKRKDQDEALARVFGLLERTRAEMLGILADDVAGSSAPAQYDRFLAQQKEQAILRQMELLARDALAYSDERLSDAAGKAVKDHAKRIGAIGGTGEPIIGVDPSTLAFVQDFAGAQIRGVLDSVRSKVNSAMQRAIAGALDLRALQREVRDAFGGDVTAARIERIVRTETVRSYSQAQAAADEQLVDRDVDLDVIKLWRSSKDTRTRASHRAIDGQERELWQPFHLGEGAAASTGPDEGVGFEANGPADPSLPAEEGINCRCTVIYVPRERARQPYIEKDRDKARATKRSAMGAIA